jgi:hypothetical protein
VGLGFDWFMTSPDKKRTGVIGIRAGYSGDIWGPKSWHSDGTTITDLPSLSHNGGYVRLVFGGMCNCRCDRHGKTPAAPLPVPAGQ